MTAALIVWGALALAVWGWLLWRSPGMLVAKAPPGPWNAADAVFGGLISAWLIFVIAMSGEDGRAPLTPEMLRGQVFTCGIYIVLFASVAFRRGQSPQLVFGLIPAHPIRAILIGVACIVSVYPFLQGLSLFMEWLGFSLSKADPLVNFLRDKLSNADAAWAFALVIVGAPLMEELIFRGYLYGVMKKYVGRLAAMATCALLFAAVHENLPALPVYFALAASLTLAYEFTGSLWTPIAMHMTFNLVPLIVVLYFPQWIGKV